MEELSYIQMRRLTLIQATSPNLSTNFLSLFDSTETYYREGNSEIIGLHLGGPFALEAG